MARSSNGHRSANGHTNGNGVAKGKESMFAEFQRYHQNLFNILVHVPTSHLMIFGILYALRAFGDVTAISAAGVITFAGFFITEFSLLQHLVSLVNHLAILYTVAVYENPFEFVSIPWADGLILYAVGYGMQEAAHWITGEQTFERVYMNSDYLSTQAKYTKLFLHALWMIPFCTNNLLSLSAVFQFFAAFVPFSASVLFAGSLSSSEEKSTLERVRQWVLKQNPPTDVTSHWWYDNLDGGIKKDFQALSHSETIFQKLADSFPSKFYHVEAVPEMDEIYVASLRVTANSDLVFYTSHIDGPFAIYPFSGVYRCILAVSENSQVVTIFENLPFRQTLTTADFIGFDFNREIHRIESDPSRPNKSYRIVLKLHYFVTPRFAYYLGYPLRWATALYDAIARQSFLATLRPKNVLQYLLWAFIMFCTYTMMGIEQYIGWNNLAYLIFISAIKILDLVPESLQSPYWFIVSYLHYGIYIGTFYFQKWPVRHGIVMRNAWLFKMNAWAHLFIPLVFQTEWEWDTRDILSVALIFGGGFLSLSATSVLGMNRTYFGSELGVCPYERFNAFPYNSIPHPMILGSVLTLSGVFIKLVNYTQLVPLWIIPLHICFYLTHAAQEHFNVFAKKSKNQHNAMDHLRNEVLRQSAVAGN